MRVCQPHWDKLKAAIDARGLSHLIAKGGEAATKNLVSELTEGSKPSNFDPLMAAHNMILGAQLERSGLAVMMPTETGGDRCPLCCYCDAPDCPKEMRGWIEGATNDVFEQAKKLGLVKET